MTNNMKHNKGHEANNSYRDNTRTYTRKRYRVKSKLRFITSLVIMFAMILGIGSYIMGTANSIALTKDTYEIEYVNSGDTLWSIAQKYKSDDTDTRHAVYEICKANDITSDQLQSGMKLIIPDNL